MIAPLRESFNRSFTRAKYAALLSRLDGECGTHVGFRVCETPVFLPGSLLRQMEQAGIEIVSQLMENRTYLEESSQAIPGEFRVPRDTPHPLFLAVDFGITRDESGQIAPRLIELQGFPTLYAYQIVLAKTYREVYGLDPGLRSLPPGMDEAQYVRMFRSAVLGEHSPENVVLMEIDPMRQKTLPDFILSERLCGITTLNIRDVIRRGNRLFYRGARGKETPIHRIYNRTIVDDLVRSGAEIPFDFRDDLEVEWAGHPNWFFRLSKFSLPYLSHPMVPKTRRISGTGDIPENLDRWVLKPLFSFAGTGVIVGPQRADIDAIPRGERDRFVLQERVDYGEEIRTPHGTTKAEVRVMYLWLERLLAVNTLVRLGRGKMMGVDFNKYLEWVGSSAAFTPGS